MKHNYIAVTNYDQQQYTQRKYSYKDIYYKNGQKSQQQLFSEYSENKQTQRNGQKIIKQKQSTTSLLNYSQTRSFIQTQSTQILIHKLIALLIQKQNIQIHIQNSLMIKGYNTDTSTQIASIVANSFGQYISIAQKIGTKIKMNTNQSKEHTLQKAIVQNNLLKIENKKQQQILNKLQQQNQKLTCKILQFHKKEAHQHENYLYNQKIQQSIGQTISQMNQLQINMYQQLSILQSKLLTITNKINQTYNNNHLIHRPLQQISINDNNYNSKQNINEQKTQRYNESVLKQKIQEKNKEIKELKLKLDHITKQLELQNQLYDQMCSKNIQLQKQLFFLKSHSLSVDSSLNIVQGMSFHHSLHHD